MKTTLLLTALLSLSFAAPSQTTTFVVAMSGPAEAPSNASPGVGAATVTHDQALHTLTVQASFSGLLGTTTASHIHAPTAAPFTGTASVATTTPSFTGFPLGVTSGTYDHTFDLTLASSYRAQFITANGGTPAGAEAALLAAMIAGKSYFNIHSSLFAGGEIRGFLQLDSDADGVADSKDAFPNSRDVNSTVKIGSCDTGVPNKVFDDGSTISDLIYALGQGVRNHGQFVSRVAHLKTELLAAGEITAQQAASIQSCAARTKEL